MFQLLVLGLVAVNANYLKDNVRKNIGGDRVLEIKSEYLTDDLVKTLHSLDADHFGSHPESKHFKLDKDSVEHLKSINVEFTDNTEAWISHFESNFAQEDFLCQEEDCATRDLQDFYSSYQSLDALHTRAKNLVSSASSSLNAKIGSLGLSYEGRDQLTVELGKGDKPLVFWFCNIHSREWLTPMYCMYMAEMLLVGEVTELLESFDFTILISANPDGYVYSQTSDSFWRKTRRPNPGSSCVGTDPNRNYDFYHCGEGTSQSPCSDAFCGPEPWSEKIVQNIRDYTLAEKNRLITISDIHAYGSLWMFPYGAIRDEASEPDYSKMSRCSLAVANAIKATSGGRLWKYGPIHSTIYPAAGSSVDYFYEEIGVIYSFAAELRGSSFQPSTSNIMISNQEVFNGMVASLQCIAQEENIPLKTVTLPTPIQLAEEKPCDFLFC